MAELQGVKNDLKSDQTEQQRLNDLLKKLQDDKRKLGQRVTKLTTTGVPPHIFQGSWFS